MVNPSGSNPSNEQKKEGFLQPLSPDAGLNRDTPFSHLVKANNIEKALQAWEDGWYVYSRIALWHQLQGIDHGIPNIGILQNYKHFRNYLLGTTPLKRQDFRIPDVSEKASIPFYGEHQGAFHDIVERWVRGSKRVYALSEDLQLQIEHTSIKDVTWREIKLPFESFAISLRHPLEYMERKWGLIIAARETDSSVGIYLVSDDTANYTPIREEKKQRIEKALKQSNRAISLKETRRALNRVLTQSGVTGMIINDGQANVLESIATEPIRTQEVRDFALSVIRIVAGFPLFLMHSENRTLYSPGIDNEAEKSEGLATDSRQSQRRRVTNAMNVCLVDSIISFSEQQREILRTRSSRSGYEVSCHFREGHWRRPPGKGDDLTAAKTIWIPPTIVRRDRLQQGDAIPGTLKKKRE